MFENFELSHFECFRVEFLLFPAITITKNGQTRILQTVGKVLSLENSVLATIIAHHYPRRDARTNSVHERTHL
jgi:hypothetical protein